MAFAKEDELGALWIREGKSGKFLSGKLKDGTEIVMFKNIHKKDGEKGPDYRIYKSTPRPQTQAKPQAPKIANPADHDLGLSDDFDPFA